MSLEFSPMRSLIYVDVVKEDYRVKLENWLYAHHIPDSISQFEPYVSKYAFYSALPTPSEGERFGAIRMQLTEHYWMVNMFKSDLQVKTFTEYFPTDVLKWQGNMPDDDPRESVKPPYLETERNMEGDDARATGGNNGMPPFIFAFIPIGWEEDLKGKGRTIKDGPNYRWQFVIKYPEGVSIEEGDKWLYEEVIPKFQAMPEVNRILTSKIMQDVNNCPFQRVVEMWFEGPSAWYKCAVENAKNITKPSWAKYDQFPYLKPKFEIASMFLSDIPRSDNYSQYRGYITMR